MAKTKKSILAVEIAEALKSKKAQNVVVLDLQETEQDVCDYFVICHGMSKVQTQSIVDNTVSDIRKKTKQKPIHIEGYQNAEWILLDYGDVIVHVFLEEFRQFFQIEDVWADAKVVSLDD